MNSVFSAFKSSKADTKPKLIGKKLTQDSSYENLRHIREIGSSAKMSNFVDGDDDETSSSGTHTIRLGKRCQTPLPSPIAELNAELEFDSGKDTVDHQIIDGDHNEIIHNQSVDNCSNITPKAISASESNLCDSEHNMCSSNSSNRSSGSNSNSEQPKPSPCSSLRSFPTSQIASAIPTANFSSEGDILSSCSKIVHNSCSSNNYSNANRTDISTNNTSSSPSLPAYSSVSSSNISSSDSVHAPIIIAANSRGHSESNLSANKTNRFQKRLSLSGFTNNSMPSVHGRPTSGGTNGSSETKKTRLSTHQRNLSLDFR